MAARSVSAHTQGRDSGRLWSEGGRSTKRRWKLPADLAGLLERFKTGSYRAPAVRRVHIPKEDAQSKTRHIGIPTPEDNLQWAVLMCWSRFTSKTL
jgi:hypothetical protein